MGCDRIVEIYIYIYFNDPLEILAPVITMYFTDPFAVNNYKL